MVNSVGASPVGLKRFPETEEFTKPAIIMITLSFPRFLKIMRLPKNDNPSFLRVFGDYEFTKGRTLNRRVAPRVSFEFLAICQKGDYEFTKRPLVNSVGASPVGLKRFPKTEEFTKPAIIMITLSFLQFVEDYEFTKK